MVTPVDDLLDAGDDDRLSYLDPASPFTTACRRVLEARAERGLYP